MSDPWDILSTNFNTTKDESNIPAHVADNILIAWPVILQFIQQHAPKSDHLRLLEYGCGTGSFAYKLNDLGYKVIGVDSSKEMLRIARSAYGEKINFISGDTSNLSSIEPFSVITSVMTFQFIENIEKAFKDLASVIEKNGILIFAVHNPAQIKDYLNKEILFQDFDSKKDPKKGILNLGSNKIPIFIRTASEYNHILQKYGFQPILETYPPFTKEFLDKFPASYPTDIPEFLILGYKKL